MTEQNKDTKNRISNKQSSDQLDAAGKSLSEAFRISFVILKIIMIVLVIVFLASGFRVVDPDENALVLRFGKIQGLGDERLLGPGLHWILPYPIDKIIKIPVEKNVNLAINSFWYYESDLELASPTKRPVPPSEPLYPTRDGYCLTRSEKQSAAIVGEDGSDYNIVHLKWQLTYQIVDPESFFKNVYVEEVEPGQDYFKVITKSINPLLKAVFDDAVVTAMVHYTIDDALSSKDDIRKDVVKLMQQKLRHQINSGIKVVAVQLTEKTWPRQVDHAFQALSRAEQQSDTAINKAETYKETLRSQAAGAAQVKIARARAYATEVVEDAEAEAEYLEKILPEFRKWPEIFIQNIRSDAIGEVYDNADEKVIVQPTEGPGGKKEIRLIVSGNVKKSKKQ
ncbi:MAG: protease modulator HflK [Planctomycetota bacterium]|jgi:membrane protease subunit HflK